MIREWLRRSHSWVTFRRVQREGFGRAWKRWQLWRWILGTPPVRTHPVEEEDGTEVHLVCYRNDYLCAIWALKSFYREARVDWPLVIHIQGEAPPRVRKILARHFPDARIISQEEADAVVVTSLAVRGLHRLLAARLVNPYMLKLTDYALLSSARRLITIDSDVLFFREPRELVAYDGAHLFQRDLESTYVANAVPGVTPLPRVNVGLMSFLRESVSLERCDEYLLHFPKLEGWLEQTLYALLAAERGEADWLPDAYLISLDAGVDPAGLTARHYAGPSRPLLSAEGMPFLRNRWKTT